MKLQRKIPLLGSFAWCSVTFHSDRWRAGGGFLFQRGMASGHPYLFQNWSLPWDSHSKSRQSGRQKWMEGGRGEVNDSNQLQLRGNPFRATGLNVVLNLACGPGLVFWPHTPAPSVCLCLSYTHILHIGWCLLTLVLEVIFFPGLFFFSDFHLKCQGCPHLIHLLS